MATRKKTAAKKKAATKRKGAMTRAAKRAKKKAAARKPKAGTTLTRAYKGEEHKVTIAKDGTYRFGGETYKSLTAIAKEITGYASVSGPRFFGIDEANQKGGSK